MKTFLSKCLTFFWSKSNHKEYSFNSREYWESRYQNGGNSGSGSYGCLANFKAEVLNDFVNKHQIKSIIEFGSGDGNQLNLANYPKYIGYDVSEKAIEICKEKFKQDPTKEFRILEESLSLNGHAELCLSLDVIFHLIEYPVFDSYMRTLFSSSTNYVIIYSSNNEFEMAKHVKSRDFQKWIIKNLGNKWELFRVVKNKYPYNETKPDETSFSDFFFYKKVN
ncbi:hypothetical protein [Leeuwenhoekiella marinoflava]|uniref:hypothetical protein n=1 Tax=Leeuwenhoekiella marinoflava TaxID=988 RepID=UPI0030037BA1